MRNPILNFLKKTYKVLIVILGAVIFFLGYNTYLVDRSLTNLRFALNKIDDIKNIKDAKKLAAVFEATLAMEVASKDLSPANIAKAEAAKGVLSRPETMSGVGKDAKVVSMALYSALLGEVANEELQVSNLSRIEIAKDMIKRLEDPSQIEEVKFALKQVIKDKEQKRLPLLVALDRINEMIVPAVRKISKAQLENQARYLENRLEILKDKIELQQGYYELANIYTQLSEFTKAREACEKVIGLDPESKLAKKSQFNLAWNEKLKGNLDVAIKEFEVLSQPGTQDELSVFSQYQIADSLRQKGDYEKAASIYNQIAKQMPGKDLAEICQLQAGRIYIYDLKDYEKAKDAIEQLKTTGGSQMAVHLEDKALLSIGRAYRKEGLKLLSEGYKLSRPEKYKEALKKFDKALEINPKDGNSYVGKALALLWLGDPDTALVFAKRAGELSPDDEMAIVNLGFIYIKLNLLDEAISEFKRLISINPLTFHGYYNLGYTCAISNRFEEAVDAFKRATKIVPNLSIAYNNLGWCYWQLGQYAQAIETFEKATQITPNYSEALFNLGLVYMSIGRYREARNKFEAILKINPKFPEVQDNLAAIRRISQ